MSNLEQLAVLPADGLLADLGISSHQIDEASRGFSTRFDAGLDMRMDQRTSTTAQHIINNYSLTALVNVFSEYGEIRNSKQLANTIEKARRVEQITSTQQLKKVLRTCFAPEKEHQYMACVFQALRIEVNQELEALKELLEQSPKVLREGGKLVVIAYHSLEDRMVKNMINTGNVNGELHKDIYGNVIGKFYNAVTKKPIVPSAAEISSNPRSRSARLRVAARI